MTRRAIRLSGGETPEERATRLADVALASVEAVADEPMWNVSHLRAFFCAGYRTACEDMVEVKPLRRRGG